MTLKNRSYSGSSRLPLAIFSLFSKDVPRKSVPLSYVLAPEGSMLFFSAFFWSVWYGEFRPSLESQRERYHLNHRKRGKRLNIYIYIYIYIYKDDYKDLIMLFDQEFISMVSLAA